MPPTPLSGDGVPRVSRRRIAARRGIVLGLLVVCVLIFTSFFREDEGGFLHSFKGTVGSVVAPVQDVAVGAVQPIRDGWNWFAELRSAREERNRLLAENEVLRTQLDKQGTDADAARGLRETLAIADDGPDGYTQIAAQLIQRPLVDIQRRVTLDRGTGDGVVVNSLVFAPVPPTTSEGQVFGALVGRVTSVTSRSSTVTLITDPVTQVGARLQGSDTPLGLLTATASGTLNLEQVPSDILVRNDMRVVTSGVGTEQLPSPYPPDIPIGYVSSVGAREPGALQTVQITPYRQPLELRVFSVFVPTSAAAKRRATG